MAAYPKEIQNVSDDNNYEKEIEIYLNKLRRISYYQRYLMVPFLLLMALFEVYQLYYSRSWWDAFNIAAFIGCAVYNWYDSRRTFAKIMLRKLLG